MLISSSKNGATRKHKTAPEKDLKQISKRLSFPCVSYTESPRASFGTKTTTFNDLFDICLTSFLSMFRRIRFLEKHKQKIIKRSLKDVDIDLQK